jgi:hypothetical protein
LRVKAGEPAANPGNSGTPPSKGFGPRRREAKSGAGGDPKKRGERAPGSQARAQAPFPPPRRRGASARSWDEEPGGGPTA